MHRYTQQLLRAMVLASVFTVGLSLPGAAQVKEPVWVYEPGPFGPTNWGNITKPDGSKMYPNCSGGPKGQGSEQTPIDITDPKLPEPPEIAVKYGKTPLIILNDYRSIKVYNENSKNRLVVDGEEFRLIQFHFHTPSEHEVNGEPVAMEAHFVHLNSFDEFAVLGVFYTLGKANRTLAKIFAHAPRDNGTYVAGEKDVEGKFVNPIGLLPRETGYFHYNPGSLTTPPCSEEIKWFLLKTPATVSADQVKTYTQILTDVQAFPTNHRPIQDREGRAIFENQDGGVIFKKIRGKGIHDIDGIQKKIKKLIDGLVILEKKGGKGRYELPY